MKKKEIVYPDGDAGTEEQIDSGLRLRLESVGNFTLHNDAPENNEIFIERIRKANAIVLGWSLPNEVMREAKDLEMISFTGIGVQKFVDMQSAHDRGITVCNSPGYGDNAVAEHALALLLASAKNISGYDKDLKTGLWRSEGRGIELCGKTIGLVGFGGIAQAFARMVDALGMRVIVWTRSKNKYQSLFPGVEFVDFDRLLEDSDVLSIHIAHTPQTENLISREVLDRLKPGALLINTARGEIVDEEALIEVLADGRLAAAGLDVFHTEPLEQSNKLTLLDNVVLTPHIAFSTPEASQRLTRIALKNVVDFFSGNPINIVN